MKINWKLCSVILAICLFSGCTGKGKTENRLETDLKSSHDLNITVDMLTTEKDLSCGMILKNEIISDTAIYKGQLYGFCCDHCKNEFKKDPDKLISVLE